MRWLLALTACAVGAASALTSTPWQTVVLYETASALALVLCWTGVRRLPVEARAAWQLVAVATTSFVAGDAVWDSYDLRGVEVPAISPADILYVGGYVVLALAVIRVINDRTRTPREALLDGSAFAAAAGVAIWQLVAKRGAVDDLDRATRFMLALYPMMDVVVLAALLWLVLSPGRRSRSVQLLAAAIAWFALLDVGYAVFSAGSRSTLLDVVDAMYPMVYAVIGLAITDRSAASVTASRPQDLDHATSHLHPGRVCLLGVALLVAPATAAVSASGAILSDRMFQLVVSCLIASIVLARFTLAARDGESARAEITYRATHDELTGLANRRAFLTAVDAAARDSAALAAMIYLDLDGFKEVNDCYGHQSGDEVLRAVARCLRACVRAQDVIARLGGDEFAVLCPDVPSASDASILADRVRAEIGREVRYEELAVSASVGIAVANVARCADLVGIADAAMYDAKRRGGDCVVLQTI